MKITITSLKDQLLKIVGKNLNTGQAIKVVEYLLWAEMSGVKTQGIVKLTGTEPLQDIVPQYDVKTLRDTKLSQLVDAGSNPAPLVACMGTDVAIEKAKSHGFGLVGIKGTYSSNGAQAFYVDKIARHDLIGIMCSRQPASAAAFGGIDAVFGTNPIGFGFPTQGEPVVFDTATSAMTFYGLILAKARGEQIPEGVAIDENGDITTNPAAAMDGAILPFDKGHKGSGFAMAIEILAGPLVSGAWVDNATFKEEWGTLIMAIDPELLVDLDAFKANTSDLLEKVKVARTKESDEVVRLPGERAQDSRKECLENGMVEIDDIIAKQLEITAV